MNAVLQPAGAAAQDVALMAWVLIAGGGLIFAGVMLLLALSLRSRAQEVHARRWLLGAGVAFPGVVLVLLFVWSMVKTPDWKPVPPGDALVIAVHARMWWWEVRYRDPVTGAQVHAANEIRIPAGRPVFLALGSADVIHSFWVPQLAGKIDMVPGRVHHLLVSANTPGVYRGQCAEFCGEQHARMALHVVAQPQGEFDAWLAAQARPAGPPATARQAAGRDAFLARRCDACHAVRGVTGDARLAPDLTHVGSRLHIGAGTLPNTHASRMQWIAHVQDAKPGARMPAQAHLDADTLGAISEWLGALR